jgi:hypothetical protein
VENIAPESSAIYLVNNAYPIIVNSIIWHNNNQSIGFGSQNDAWSIPQINFSNIEGGWSLEVLPNYLPDGWEGIGNIDIYPFFTDLQNNDYTLQEFSSCIDSGTADIDGDGVDDIIDYIGLAPDMGAFEFGVELSNDEENIPTVYTLKTPYPNPFNPVININFSVPNHDRVSISIYDIYGRLVTTLANSYFHPGHHSITWNANSYASGVYFIKMQSADFLETQKVMLLK